MPEKKDYGKDKTTGKTIVGFASTERGSRFPILEGEDKKAALARHLDALQGRNSQQHLADLEGVKVKKFVKRFNLAKTPFKIREQVTFDGFEKIGTVSGFSGDSLNILTKDGRTHSKHRDAVFKTSEMLGGFHWDGISLEDRLSILQKSNVNETYLNNSWYYIPYTVRNVIQKAMGPAGYEGGGVNTGTGGVYNPVHQEKTVAEKIKEEEKKPTKSPTIADEQSNRGSGKQEPEKHYTITEVQAQPGASSGNPGDKPTQENNPKEEKKEGY